jgi:hypothetical protein
MPRHPTIGSTMALLLSNVKVWPRKGPMWAKAVTVAVGGRLMLAAAHHPEEPLRPTLRGAACSAVAVTILAACDATLVTRPTAARTGSPAGPSATVALIGADTLRPCPEIAIPELPCVRREPRQPPGTVQK